MGSNGRDWGSRPEEDREIQKDIAAIHMIDYWARTDQITQEQRKKMLEELREGLGNSQYNMTDGNVPRE